MGKDIILEFALDKKLMDEILKHDYKARIIKKSEYSDSRYILTLPKSDDEVWRIKEDGLLYLNDFVALNVSGQENQKRVVYRTADLELISGRCYIKKNGILYRIYPATYYILESFMTAPDGVVTRKTLVERLEQINHRFIQDNTLNQHINRAKKILGTYNGQEYFSCIYDVGYRWNFEIEVDTED